MTDNKNNEMDILKIYKPNLSKRIHNLFRLVTSNKKLLFGVIVIFILCIVAIFADNITPYSYAEMNMNSSFLAPSWQHLCGTDNYGRDMFSRILYGTRVSLGASFFSVFLSFLVGLPLGLLAGYFGKITDVIIMRFSDVIFSFPSIMLAILIAAIIGPGTQTVILAISIAFLPSVIRISRSMVLSVKEREYIDAAKVLGVGRLKIMYKYILPNSIGPIIVHSTLLISNAILSEAAISYLGYGTPPPTPTWGYLLSWGQNFFFKAPYMCILPGIAIIIAVVAVNMLGDGLRDLLDPKFRGKVI